MRRWLASILLCTTAFALSGCGSSLTTDDGTRTRGTGFSKNNIPYVTDDRRVQDELDKPAEPTPTPETTAKPQPKIEPPVKPVAAVPLHEHLREFEISRYGGNGAVARFGTKSAQIKFFFDNQATVTFTAPLGGAGNDFTFTAKAGKFTLTGTLKDTQPTETLGEFTLTGAGETAKVFYRAYKAGLKVREDATKKPLPGSISEKQIRALGDGTFAWVNNWAVVRGRAVYLIDIVKTSPSVEVPFFAFKGESLQTGEEEHKAETVGGKADVTLVGNGEETPGKIFSVKLDDPAAKEQTEVMVDVDVDEKPEERISPEERGPQIPAVTDDDGMDQMIETPETAPIPGPKPKTKPGPVAQPEIKPEPAGTAYLKIDTSLRRTGRMVRDFNQNRNVPGVRTAIANYQKNRQTLNAFYKYANPFRHMIQAIGRAFDVSPAYAYLTVIESSYFTGGKYYNRDNSGVALGIFQFKYKTANSLDMRVYANGASGDERYYFAPSACGAAKYIRKLVDSFDDGDTTMAILGYNQGEGGAAAAIGCSLDARSRGDCHRINNGMSGKEYARYIKLAKNYNYKYAEIERVAAISAAMRSYVNRKLAIYFISSNMKQYGFSIPAGAPTRLPGNGSVMPPNAIQDSLCRSTVNSL